MLYFTPSTLKDATKLKTILDDSPFSYYYDYYYYGYFTFEEEDLDELEIALTQIIETNDIDGFFEVVIKINHRN